MGRNKEGEVVFPECFVKLDKRPDFPYAAVASEEGGNLVPVPSEIRIFQYFVMYDRPEQAIAEFNKYNANDVVSGTLRLYDGVGEVMEEWNFHDAVMTLADKDDGDSGIIAEWSVAYQNKGVTWRLG